MHTLFDFITHVKGIEYIFSLTFIAGYILYWELLKPKPFGSVANAGREDLTFIRETGRQNMYKTIGRIATAPFIGLAYVVALPFVFAYAIFSAVTGAVLGMIGREAAFGWRPAEAYLAGRKKEKKEEEKKEDEKE
jgi:hypothetical protein